MSARERWQANCPIYKRDVGTASGRFATHNKPNSLDICKGSRRYHELCGAPGMVAGETCVLPRGCEYRITPRRATFDQALKTPRYAWGKALNLAGGLKIGKA